MTRLGLKGHKGGSEMGFVIADGVIRSHQGVGIAFPVPGEHSHLGLFFETLLYFRIGCPTGLHHTVAVAPAAGLLHQQINSGLVHFIGKRFVGFSAEVTPEGLLEVLPQMLGHGLLGILLHLVIDCCVDSESIPVKAVGGTVRLFVLVQPAVKLIVRPLEGIHNIVLILGVG